MENGIDFNFGANETRPPIERVRELIALIDALPGPQKLRQPPKDDAEFRRYYELGRRMLDDAEVNTVMQAYIRKARKR